jgi:hypothetical protein
MPAAARPRWLAAGARQRPVPRAHGLGGRRLGGRRPDAALAGPDGSAHAERGDRRRAHGRHRPRLGVRGRRGRAGDLARGREHSSCGATAPGGAPSTVRPCRAPRPAGHADGADYLDLGRRPTARRQAPTSRPRRPRPSQRIVFRCRSTGRRACRACTPDARAARAGRRARARASRVHTTRGSPAAARRARRAPSSAPGARSRTTGPWPRLAALDVRRRSCHVPMPDGTRLDATASCRRASTHPPPPGAECTSPAARRRRR